MADPFRIYIKDPGLSDRAENWTMLGTAWDANAARATMRSFADLYDVRIWTIGGGLLAQAIRPAPQARQS